LRQGTAGNELAARQCVLDVILKCDMERHGTLKNSGSRRPKIPATEAPLIIEHS
jgi:hypothetical protein